MNSVRPSVLLTGSTGVIGTSLLTALTVDHEVTALVHRRRPASATTCVQGDLTADDLGLTCPQRRELAAATDIIVHCAGFTDFAPRDLRAFDINAEGTRRILELADEANAPVVLLSSVAAAMDVVGDDVAARSMRAYGHSKRRAEEFAARSGQDISVVRTALLFAPRDAQAAPRQQLPHALFAALLQARPGGLPLLRDHWCDVLPMESLVRYVTELTKAQLRGDTSAHGLHWVTAGPLRLTAADIEQACLDMLRGAGLPAPASLLADPATIPARTHGLGRLAQLGFQPPAQPHLPSHLNRTFPAQLTRDTVMDALTHSIGLCAPRP